MLNPKHHKEGVGRRKGRKRREGRKERRKNQNMVAYFRPHPIPITVTGRETRKESPQHFADFFDTRS